MDINNCYWDDKSRCFILAEKSFAKEHKNGKELYKLLREQCAQRSEVISLDWPLIEEDFNIDKYKFLEECDRFDKLDWDVKEFGRDE